MSKPKFQLLWVDLTVALQEAELPPLVRDYCDIHYCRNITEISELVTERRIEIVCFDFDYPNRSGLRLLQEFKVEHPSLPVLMFTLQHSENLAIWSFRSRVWDYLVKPVTNNEIERVFEALGEMLNDRRAQGGRPLRAIAQKIPQEAARAAPSEDELAFLPAVNYVEKHFRAKIRAEDVAKECHMSHFRFSRGFKEHFNIGFRSMCCSTVCTKPSACWKIPTRS